MSTSHDTGHDHHEEGPITRIYTKKWSFLAMFVIIFGLMLWVLEGAGFVPNAIAMDDSTSQTDSSATPVQTVTTSALVTGPAAAVSNDIAAVSGELPVKVVIPAINLSQKVQNPSTTNVESLDNYLLTGTVRYPTSATLGQQGNVIIFGHSSYLPIVHNQEFKAFDGIQNLKSGDQIIVYSNEHQYVYSVTNVQQESATSDAIPLTTSGYTLTLATCDSFGQKTDRFVVTATLVGSYALGN